MDATPALPPLGPAHRRRLREVWRSAGWPCHDALELDLLAAGMLQRRWDAAQRERLVPSDQGLIWLAAARQRTQRALDAHETLVAQVASWLQQREGRIVWRGLSLRAPLPGDAALAPTTRWVLARPDVFSIRHTTSPALLWPVAHEIKVSRADLLSDLRQPDKGAAYEALASACWYVMPAGLAEAEEIPARFGVLWAGSAGFEVRRPAPQRAMTLPFGVWMALARAAPEPVDEVSAQAPLPDLGDAGGGGEQTEAGEGSR